MKRILALLLVLSAVLALAACSKSPAVTEDEGTTLVYGSGDYTRINPAMDEHGEINVLLFSGLTAHNGSNEVVAGLAESWEYDESACTYTFHLRDGVKWHDGEPFTAEDVKFTIEAIMDPENGSENAPNFEDVEEITVPDDKTVVFRLSAPNVAFLDYMTMAILPQHLLQNENMQESDFFRHPVGTGPYKLESWDAGQSIVLVKNEDYYLGAPKIDRIIFKIVTDDNAQALQLKSGEIDLALLDPKNAKDFTDKEGYTCYDMTTADYRGILFNFWNDYWTENRDLIPAICYGIDRQAIIDSVLLGQGMAAYGPLQRNIYNDSNVEHYDYDPEKAKALLEEAGWDGSQTIRFYVNSGDSTFVNAASIIAAEWAAVGIKAEIQTVDFATLMSVAGTEDYDVLAVQYTYAPVDPYPDVAWLLGGEGSWTGYSNDTLNEALTKSQLTSDPEETKELFSVVDKKVQEDVPMFSAYVISAQGAVSKRITGAAPSVYGFFNDVQNWDVVE